MNCLVRMLSVLLTAHMVVGSIGAQGSNEKDEVLSARKTEREAKKNREECQKMGFPASAQDNRCFVFYPSALLTWGKGFSSGLAKVTVNGKAGFINTQGKLVIDANLRDAGSFSDGLAPFEHFNGKWGYIDRKGSVVIRPRFDWAISFSEGLALVQIGKLWGYIDTSGKLAIPATFEEADSFSEGTAVVGYYDKEIEWMAAYKRKGKWVRRFIDKRGAPAISETYDIIHRGFNGGMAIVSRSLGYSEKFQAMISETYVIDRSGRELWKLNSATTTWFSEDTIVVEISRTEKVYDSPHNFLDRNGKMLCPTNYENPSSFSEGLAVVRVSGKYGYLNKSCNFVLEPQFKEANSFSEGLAWVKDDAGFEGFIDRTGAKVIPTKYKWVSSFTEGFALVLEGDKAGYIDKSGKVVWRPTK